MNSLEAHENQRKLNWLDILGDGQLKKKVIKHGNGHRPEPSFICVVSYQGSLRDGTVVDKEVQIKVQVGDLEVVEGLDLALTFMSVNETALLLVAPQFGYGTFGRVPLIGPDETLWYTVKLHSAEPELQLRSYTMAQRKDTGISKRARGNWWFTREQPALAIRCYRRALHYLDEDDDETQPEPIGLDNLLEERVKVHNNMAAALTKMDEFGSALESVNYVLRHQPDNVKALFRKGKIFQATGHYDKSVEVLKIATRLEPANKAIKHELIRVKNLKKRKEEIAEKNLCKRMFRQEKKAETKGDDVGPKKSFPWGWVLAGTTAVVVGVAAYRYYW